MTHCTQIRALLLHRLCLHVGLEASTGRGTGAPWSRPTLGRLAADRTMPLPSLGKCRALPASDHSSTWPWPISKSMTECHKMYEFVRGGLHERAC